MKEDYLRIVGLTLMVELNELRTQLVDALRGPLLADVVRHHALVDQLAAHVQALQALNIPTEGAIQQDVASIGDQLEAAVRRELEPRKLTLEAAHAVV